MRKILYLLIGLVSLTLNAQAPSLQFSKAFGGSTDEVTNSIVQTTDGGYIFVGTSTSTNGDVTVNHGGEDVWVVKLTSTGTIDWQKSYGGTGNDRGYSIVQISDGYVIAGSTTSTDGDVTDTNNGSGDVWVFKINNTGTLNSTFNECYGGLGVDTAFSIKPTTNISGNVDGFIIAGSSQSSDGDLTFNNGSTDGWVLKINTFGNILFQKSFGGTLADVLNSAQQTTDGGFIVTGYTASNNGDILLNKGGNDFWILKLTNNLTPSWSKTFGGNANDFSNYSQQTTDGGFIITGYTLSSSGSDVPNGDVINTNGSEDIWVIKLNNSGILQWQNALGGTGEERSYSIKQTAEGGYIVAGQTNSTDGDVITGTPHTGAGDAWVVKLSTVGDLQWEKNLGGGGLDYFNSVQTTSDGGYIVAGRTNSTNGDLTGSGSHSGTTYDSWVAKFASDPLDVTTFTTNNLKLYPNPATTVVNISTDVEFDRVTITDLTGKIVVQQNSTTSISVSELSAGIYVLTAYSEQGQLQKKFIKQ